MDTRDLAIFVQAAAAGSLSAAARRLEITPMAASRRLAALEQQLGVRLMHRTTRAVSLTAEGEAFLPHAQAMIESEHAARAALAPTARGASGLLRITAPAAFGRKVVTPLVPDILAANPELRIDLQLTDAVVDIVGAGIDVAVRIGRLRDSTLIARRLAPNPRRLCASPAYVARAGRPEQLADLAAHDCLTLTGQTHWPFEAGGRRREVRVNGPLSSSSIEAVRVACCGGLGLALLSAWDVADDLAAGRLVALALADAEPEELAIWAVYPTARLIPPKVHAFIEALTRRLRPPPAR
jgi:DNA-binding transcriptional LysR family regulator